jgi:hypothetical protein
MSTRRNTLLTLPVRLCILAAVGFSIASSLYAAPGDSEMQILSDSLRGKPAKYAIPELQGALAWLQNNPVPDERRKQLSALCCDIVEKGIVYKDQPGYAYGKDPAFRISRDALSVVSAQRLTNALPRLIAYFVEQRFSQGQTRKDVMGCVDALGAKNDLIRAVQFRWIELTLAQLPGSRKLTDAQRKELGEITKIALQKEVDNISGSREVETLLFKALQFDDPSLAPTIVTILQKPGSNWILKQNGIKMLGDLQSEEAIPFLAGILKQPIPHTADLKDYGAVDAILRSHAAMALGKIGNLKTVTFLERVSKDRREFVRVREFARRALADIKKRVDKAKILNDCIDIIEKEPGDLHDYWVQVQNDRHYELSLQDAEAIRNRLLRRKDQLARSGDLR